MFLTKSCRSIPVYSSMKWGLNSYFKGFFIQQYLIHQYLLGAYCVLKIMVESKTKFLFSVGNGEQPSTDLIPGSEVVR